MEVFYHENANVSSILHEIADVSMMSNKIADVSTMWCDVARDCQCVGDVVNVGNVPKTLTLPKDIEEHHF
jgi:hypothetical protein